MSQTTTQRGPPPCQHPDCAETAHFSTEYVYCIEHEDEPFVAPPLVEDETVGISNGSFTFYFGASCGSSRKTLRQLEEPNVCLSYATKNNKPWESIDALMVDSGGYSLIKRGEGEYPDTVDDYLEYVERHQPKWFITRDVPTNTRVLNTLDGGVSEAIDRSINYTVETIDALSDYDIDGEPVAVLQGTTPREYVNCYYELKRLDSVTGRLAIGSLKQHRPIEVAHIISAVADVVHDDVELHGLGVDVPDLKYESVKNALSSADSSRYIATARWRGNRGETPPRLRDDEPKQSWFETTRAYLDMRSDLRCVLDQEAIETETTVQNKIV